MKAPLSWIKEYVDIQDLSLEEICKIMTGVGLEIDGVTLVGLPIPPGEKHEFKYEGLSWPEDKFIVAQVNEVMPHPDANRLVLCRLFDGTQELIVLTGAPNLYPMKGIGPLDTPLKVAYAREGAVLYDGHQPGQVLSKLKRMKIRGVDSSSMICSEKELGISEEHEGVIILDDDAPTGMSLVDYMGDAILDVNILPNMVRNASILGMAREIAAKTGRELKEPQEHLEMNGKPITGRAAIEIKDPQLNPRFVLGLIEGTTPKESPYWVRRRLSLAGMRPINALVDATNYTMLELGEPLHAFDYDILTRRAGGKAPTIITRAANEGEQLTTLDSNKYTLDAGMILVADTAGALSLAGVMGGLESEVTLATSNVLLEGASWNFINIRKTMSKLKITSEAAYRFSRGIHPALAERSVRLCLQRMQAWGGGDVAQGLIDAYPQPYEDPVVEITATDVQRVLGISLSMDEMTGILTRLGFTCQVKGDTLTAKAPPTRCDIGTGLIGKADLLEEIARMHGYEAIPEARLSQDLPPQRVNRKLEIEELARDLLINLGLHDTVAYRQTSPEREACILQDPSQADFPEYLAIINPITPERTVLRQNILSTMLEILEHNTPHAQHLAMFEIGPVFIIKPGQQLPDEVLRIAIGMTGTRSSTTWMDKTPELMDFFDLKGVIEGLMHGLHIPQVSYRPAQYPSFHPGKCAEVLSGDEVLGMFGELHPLVKAHYAFGDAPVLVAELDAEKLLDLASILFQIEPILGFPPVIEDIAVIVDETVSAAELENTIHSSGGALLKGVKLFDIYRDEKIGAGKKSMAYNLTYQAPDRTLTDKDAATVRNRIVRALEKTYGAVLRSS
jgi:phenylalanyl-tRNA synthetase beta chain